MYVMHNWQLFPMLITLLIQSKSTRVQACLTCQNNPCLFFPQILIFVHLLTTLTTAVCCQGENHNTGY